METLACVALPMVEQQELSVANVFPFRRHALFLDKVVRGNVSLYPSHFRALFYDDRRYYYAVLY
jgi:hypothetical protein